MYDLFQQKPQEVSEVTAEDPDELPEDKFHLNDMLSLHIKVCQIAFAFVFLYL